MTGSSTTPFDTTQTSGDETGRAGRAGVPFLRAAFVQLSNEYPNSFWTDVIGAMHGLGMDRAVVQTEAYLEQDFSLNAVEDAFRAVGFPTLPPLASQPQNGFEVLDAINVYRHNTAVIGGNTRDDFPLSLGNTQYALLGSIVEQVSGKSYDTLVKEDVTDRLGVEPMILLTGIPSTHLENIEQISHGYFDVTGVGNVIPFFNENTNGVYPVMQVRGRPVVDMYDLDSFSMSNGAGGAGALVATMKSYVTFFRGLVAGGLLSPAMQTVFEQGFVEIGFGPDVTYGFGIVRRENDPEHGTVFTKNGALFGTVCEAIHASASQVTVAVCANQRDLFQGQIEFLARTLMLDLLNAAGG